MNVQTLVAAVQDVVVSIKPYCLALNGHYLVSELTNLHQKEALQATDPLRLGDIADGGRIFKLYMTATCIERKA